MIGRLTERLWNALTSPRVAVALAVVAGSMVLVSSSVEQVTLGQAVETARLRALLPGFFAVRDLSHSLVFLATSLGVAAVLVLGAGARLLSDRAMTVRWAAGIGWRLGGALTICLLLAQLFLARDVTLPLAPEETAILPSLDATVRARVTGWLPEEGVFGTVEVVPRLAGGELAGPFGGQDRSPEAPLAPDAGQVELTAGSSAVAHGMRLRLDEEPPAWAARIRVTWNGVGVTSPFLQSGRSWEVAAVPADPTLLVAVDRVIPDFDPAVPITRQSESGPARTPGVIVTLHQGGEAVGSRALAPGEQVVLGESLVLVEGFAPVVELSVSRGGAWLVAAAAAAAATAVSAAVWAVAAAGEARRRRRAEAAA